MPELDERTIFDTARRLETLDSRREYVRAACRDDRVLLARVEALLRVHEAGDDFLQHPAVPPTPPNTFKEGPGTQIGAYRLIEQLGEGGFGKVFLAEQQIPVRRQVALKVIKPGMDSSQVVARFDAERQALALMNHPNIARILDGGETESGRPYFVMELVSGEPITSYCDNHQLPPRERLALLGAVCLAVQHAHQKSIIHRDLKPANVLVADQDGQPVPKIIDFGVAKAIGQTLNNQTLHTALVGLVGTLEYMSPEQAELGSRDIDIRTDIYSLGVLLDELLTGSTPLSRGRIRQLDVTELLRIIREEEPTKPSRRLSDTQSDRAKIAAVRGLTPARLLGEVAGDLDWIALKCLEKDRTRRYVTANGLARDLERYVKGEPVEAYPPSATYKLRRFARRNRTWILAAAAAASLLVAATVISLSLAFRATVAEQTATRERIRAEAATDRATKQLYVAQMNLGQSAWEENRLGRLEALLNQYRPRQGEPDLRGFEWYYWRSQLDSPMLTLRGHRNRVVAVAYSPDGRRLASASHDGTVKLWDAATGKELGSLPRQNGTVLSVTFSKDGKFLASAGSDRSIRIWDAHDRKLLHTLTGHKNWVAEVAFSPDGSTLASVSHDGTVKLWDWAHGAMTKSLQKHTSLVISVAYSPDGRLLASASSDRTVRIWDAKSGDEVRVLKGHSDEVIHVTFSPNGTTLASTSLDRTAQLWNASSREEVRVFKGHADRIFSVAFSPDGNWLATASFDQVVKIWNVATGQETQTLKGHGSWVASVAFSPDGSKLASASDDQTVKVWDVESAQQSCLEMVKPGRTGRELCVTFSPNGKQLAGAGDDTKIKLWDPASGQLTKVLSGHKGLVHCLAFSPSGLRLASAGADKSARVWDMATGAEVLTLRASRPVLAMSYSPAGDLVATGEDDGTVRVWDASRGQEKIAFKGHAKAAQCVAFSPDGKLLATGGIDQTAKIWDLATGQEKLKLTGHGFGNKGVSSVAFSPDGAKFATAGADKTVRMWDAATGEQLLVLEGHTDWVSSVAFSPDGKRLASASADKIVKVWDSEYGLETLTLKGNSALIASVAFSPDGLRLASAGFDGLVRMWDARALTPLLRAEQEARGVVVRLLAKYGLKVEVTRQIQNDTTMRDEVRHEALKMASACQEDTKTLNDLSWSVVKRRGATPESYQRALLQAEAACRLKPDDPTFLNTLGVAQYRCDKVLDGVESLGRAAMNRRPPGERHAADVAFLAMGNFKLGQVERAKTLLSELRKLLKQPRWSSRADEVGFLSEAMDLIEGKHQSPSRG